MESKRNDESYTFFNDSTGFMQTLDYRSSGFNTGIACNIYLNDHWYIQPSVMYKQYKFLFATEYDWYDGPNSYVECYNNERTDFMKYVFSKEIRLGRVFYINRFLINAYCGIGHRVKHRKLIENNWDWIYTPIGFHRQMNQTLPTFHLGITIGYQI